MTEEAENDSLTVRIKKGVEDDCIENNGDLQKRLPYTSKVKSKLSNHDFRRKFMKTLWIGASFWVLGFAIGQRGPSFLDLQIITKTELEEASFFFTASCVGYLVGSLVAGVVYDKFNKSLLLLVCLVGMTISTIATPWCYIYGMMVAIHFIFSLFGGGTETVGNAEVMRIWGKGGETAMQFIHFSYAFGGVIGPLATEPFLTPVPEDVDENSTLHLSLETMTSVMNSTAYMNLNVTNSSSSVAQPLTTDVHYAYLICGSIMLLIIIPQVMQACTERSEQKRQTQDDGKKTEKQPLPLPLFLFVEVFLCIFFFMSVSVEDTIASYLPTFVVKQLHWSKSWGAQVTSLYWATFATGRFLSIFAVRALSSVKMLMISCMVLALSKLALLLFSLHNITVGVWISSAFIGLSLAPIFPTGFSFMEEELVRVTGKVSAAATISASTGSMSSPLFLGYLMQELTPMWYTYMMFGEAAVCLAVFLFLLAFSRLYVRKHYTIKRSKEQEIIVPASDVEENTVSDSLM